MTAPPEFEASPNDVAIVGAACHVPGARDVRSFWRNLRAGVESIRALGEEDLAARGVDPELSSRPNYVRAAVVLEDMEAFDAGFFGFTPKDAAITDPQHRHFLECAWEALEDAGHTPEGFAGPIGVFAGSGMAAYMTFNVLANRELVDEVGLFLLRHTGNDKDFLTTRVSYTFNLRGPSVNVQTACSTSLVAVHMACQSLLSGECDLALAGGVTIQLPHGVGYLYHENEILSPDGRCRPFEERAQGTVFGSGAGVVVLRRLADALADKDHVYAVIRGSAINNDGAQKVGYLAPSVDGQAAAIAEALRVADVAPETVGYVEAHGTATAVGDPIEIAALTRAFRTGTDRSGFCGVGSVKSNIGHLDTAAGVVSLIKVALALEQRELPPTLHYERPSPHIDFGSTPFYVVDSLRPWTADLGRRRAGVSSLGVGGTNAHVVVEEAPAVAPVPAPRAPQLCVLSARSEAALAAAAENLRLHLEADERSDLFDVAWTLQTGRRAFAYRRSWVARDRAELITKLAAPAGAATPTPKQPPSLVFLLPGGGAQYPAMGRDLYRSEPVYRDEVRRCLDLCEPALRAAIERLLDPRPEDLAAAATAFERPSIQLPALFIVEYALARLWMSFGLAPAALLGHSMGENTAACLAGVMSLSDALGLVVLRGQLFERVPEGGMLSVELPADELRALLGPELSLAVVNGPALCVASGPVQALDRLQTELAAREVGFRRIHISIAAHSALLDGILSEFEAYLRRIPLAAPRIPIVSNTSGEWLSDAEATSPEYWTRHLRSTVQFAAGVRTLLADPARVLLEVGPGNTLGTLVRQQCDPRVARNVHSSLRHRDEQVGDVEFALGVLGKLWCAGLAVDWRAVHRGVGARRVSLPTYPFERRRHWIEATPQPAQAGPARLTKTKDPSRWFYEPTWRRLEPQAPVPIPAGECWLVFAEPGGFGEAVASRGAARGARVVVVQPGDAFEELAPDQYTIVPQERDHYVALLETLAAKGTFPARVVHAWLVGTGDATAVTTTHLHRALEYGFYSVLFLGQALGGLALSAPIHIDVLANGMQRLGDEPLPHPAKATVIGPCRVMPKELPGVTCAVVDLVLPDGSRRNGRHEPSAGGWDALVDQALGPATTGVFALRGGALQVLAHRPVELSPAADGHSSLRENGVYLVTGGLGGIGGLIAEHLARRVRARVALLTRRPFPPREEWRARVERGPRDETTRRIASLLELEALGARTLVATGDVANIEDMRRVLDQIEREFGALNGVFHAAGTIDDGPLQIKSPAGVDRVFTPKVHGTLLLDELLAGQSLDFFAVCSSTSAILGPAGQVDYAAANAFLDAFAAQRSARGAGRTLAIAWGVWNEVGMTARAGAPTSNEPARARAAEVPVDAGPTHPLLGRRTEPDSGVIEFQAEYSCATHWILGEHRLGDGTPLIPGVGFVELAYAAGRAGAGWDDPIEIRDLSFVAPLVVRDDETRLVRVRLAREGQAFMFEAWSRGRDEGQDAWRLHAQARIARAEPGLEPAAPLEVPAGADTDDRDAQRTAQQGRHLRLGPRWRNLRALRRQGGAARARLELEPGFHADLAQHPLHPALLDMATGFALPLLEGYDARESFYAPLAYKRIVVRGALAPHVTSNARLSPGRPAQKDLAWFDVQITDGNGRLLLEVEEFAVRRLSDTSALSVTRRTERDDAVRAARAEDDGGPLARLIAHGIRPTEGMAAFERVLDACRSAQVVVSSIDLDLLRGEIERAAARPAPVTASGAPPTADFVGPRDEVERALAALWQELLGVERVGIHDDFFELGGYSLVAVRLFARVKKLYKLEYALSVLFETPTVAGLAERIRSELGPSAGGDASTTTAAEPRPKHAFLVPLHAGRAPQDTPFFLVAGMYGNIMNLRHLAGHLGADRPVYGIQARGLDGKAPPHETFEEMARDYLREVRAVQPRGPYLIGGYSGGGITAYEMAQQLTRAGEQVALLVFLDTPTTSEPPLTYGKRVRLARQRLARQGLGFFVGALQRKWEDRRRAVRLAVNRPLGKLRPYEFRTENIEAAFYRALARYTIEPYHHPVALFRPPLEEAFTLAPDHVVNSAGSWVEPQNGWGPYLPAGLDVHVVPGNHDNMVLEPNVRVLAARLRACLDRASRGALRSPAAPARGS
ncbi:MAG: SDR family NAD(P)-dependent oxidoreductase [Planctomycetes bacterium]|nr:SDR family NAD(P)-dependent oxidoreductase [Planctomycetota bacterium]